MRVHYLKHVSYEGPGMIGDWAASRGYRLTGSELFRGETPPEQSALDALVVMGGPMGVGDEADHPWLVQEKAYLRRWIEGGKPLIGICLGAQLIAEVMGAPVRRGRSPEIGWFPIRRLPQLSVTFLGGLLPPQMEVFHWHHDTFAVPDQAIPIASSDLCANQGFVYRDRVVALQFHLEMDEATARDIIQNSEAPLEPRDGVQSPATMLERPERFERMRSKLNALLDAWIES